MLQNLQAVAIQNDAAIVGAVGKFIYVDCPVLRSAKRCLRQQAGGR
jgi:hypothetical protein